MRLELIPLEIIPEATECSVLSQPLAPRCLGDPMRVSVPSVNGIGGGPRCVPLQEEDLAALGEVVGRASLAAPNDM